MKDKHTFRLLLAGSLAIAAGVGMSSCADMWMSTSSGFNFTQPGGFGLNLGVGGPIGRPVGPPPNRPSPPPNRPSPPPPGPPGGGPGFPVGPGGPPPGGPFWGPF